jgi:hypothetical protein
VYSTDKTICHDITEILLKVALNTINLTVQSKTEYDCISPILFKSDYVLPLTMKYILLIIIEKKELFHRND